MPAGLIDDILELRAYARATDTYRQACQMESGPAKDRLMASPLVQMVQQHEFADVAARIAGKVADGE